MSDRKETVRAMIHTVLAEVEDNPEFRDDDSLVLSRRLSSLQVVELASQLEQAYQLDFAELGFNQYDFDSVNSILALLQRNEKNH
jgi:acyl carrier protein